MAIVWRLVEMHLRIRVYYHHRSCEGAVIIIFESVGQIHPALALSSQSRLVTQNTLPTPFRLKEERYAIKSVSFVISVLE